MPDNFVNVREMLGGFIGKKIVDITQHDQEDYDPATGKGAFIAILLEDGYWMRFPVGESGFDWFGD